MTSHGITFDSPGYRQQRIMTALLAHVRAWVPGVSTGLVFVLVNGTALIVCVVAGVRLAEDVGRHGAWGSPLRCQRASRGLWARDLTDPVAWAGVLVAMVSIRRASSRERWASTVLALSGVITAGVGLLYVVRV